jgi:ATP-dependent helicase/nuclease subunit B
MTNIYNIPSHLPFLETLAGGILDKYGDDPLVLSNITILLPNRRSCRYLRDAFLRASDGKPLLLPSMRPLGDSDEDEMEFRLSDKVNEMPSAISPISQRLILTELIEKWQQSVRDFEDSTEKISTSQAAFLAIELASFLGEVNRYRLSINDLSEIVPDELSRHWQITLSFLHILIKFY